MTNDSLIGKLKDAAMWIETAWMDEEPMPCEVKARDLIKEVIAAMGDASNRKDAPWPRPQDEDDSPELVSREIIDNGEANYKCGYYNGVKAERERANKPVSLAQYGKMLFDKRLVGYAKDGETIAKAILTAAGVKYVD